MKNPFYFVFALVLMLSTSACKKDKGEEATTTDAQQVEEIAEAQSFNVNTATTKIMWEGYKPTATHNGTINVSSGSIDVKDGKVVGGEFTIDMNTITDLDLEGQKKESLEAHLKGTVDEKRDDFFNAPTYPTSKFEITKIVELKNDTAANSMVYGNLTMRDKTHNIGFKAQIEISDNSVSVNTPKFNIDRTKWGVNYGSKSVFDNLGDNFVNDEIGLTISLKANS